MKSKNIKIGLSLSLILLSNAVFSQLNHYVGHEAYEDDEYECKCIIDPKLPEFIFTLCIDTESHGVSRIEIRHPGNDKIIQTFRIPEMFIGFNPNDFDTLDMNFDGYPDLRLMYSSASGGADFHVWLYSPRSGKFKYDKEFSEMGDCGLDWQTKTITAVSQSGAGHGYASIYQVINNKLVLLRQEETEYKDDIKHAVRTTKYFSKKKVVSMKVDTLQESQP